MSITIAIASLSSLCAPVFDGRAALGAAASPPPVPPCERPTGDAALSVGGLPQVGGVLHLALTGVPFRPVLLLADTEDYGFSFGGLTLCIGPDPLVLANGFGNPFFVIPPNGTFRMDLPIANDPALAGVTFHVLGAFGDPNSANGLLAVSNPVHFTIEAPGPIETVFFDDFEAGWGGWWVDNGTWEIGVPASGPGAAWSGTQCAATSLSQAYPGSTDTRLVSPGITLPGIGPSEELRLNYRSWFQMASCDWMVVQVSTDSGLSWQTPACTPAQTAWTSSGVWSQASADLSAWAGQTISIGFLLHADCGDSDEGVFLDDVHVFRGTPFFQSPEDWEDGLGPWWSVSNGTWEVGVPVDGPGVANSGMQCASTSLGGDYDPYSTSRLASPPLALPAGSSSLWFHHWFSLEVCTTAVVEVSDDGGCSWTPLKTFVGNGSNGWTPVLVPLDAYAGETIRIGFRIDASCGFSSSGWSIDDIEIR